MTDSPSRDRINAFTLVPGSAEGSLLHATIGLSFWGGVDPETGMVLDPSHPLAGQCLAGRIVALPSGRGSCTGSSVMLQLILNGCAPKAMIFAEREEILTLGSIVAEELFSKSVPMVAIGPKAFADLANARTASIGDGAVTADAAVFSSGTEAEDVPVPDLELTDADCWQRDVGLSEAARTAMRIIIRMAGILGAPRLIDVTRAHIDGCIYTGPASLQFARWMVDRGARVRVPTTLNAISVDQRNWRTQGTDPALAEPASLLGDAYVAMGAAPSFTCAPYLLGDNPLKGEQIVWAESNAVVFANSVLGARTMKYPDYLDICIALTGRAPEAGCHVDHARLAKIEIAVEGIEPADDQFWPLLGYHAGVLAPNAIPVLSGLEGLSPSMDDLKAFGAAFATPSAAPMFHLAGITPEAADVKAATGGLPVRRVTVTRADLAASWKSLNPGPAGPVDLVALGNPHFSFDEFAAVARLIEGRERHKDVAVVVTTGRATMERIRAAGIAEKLEAFGARLVVDACWCSVSEPVLPPHARIIMTNSGKYAHYGPALHGRAFRFGSLADCLSAAQTGQAAQRPVWLG